MKYIVLIGTAKHVVKNIYLMSCIMKKIIKLDSQQLSALERCPQKFYYEFVKNLEPKMSAKALQKGKIMATALELLYQAVIDNQGWKTGFMNGLAFIQKSEYEDFKSETAAEQQFNLINSFTSYCAHYKNETWKPIAVEQGFSKVLYDSSDLQIIYEGKPDMVAEIDGRIVPVDHKTESAASDLHSHSNQFIGYCWALGSEEIWVNYIGLQKKKSPEEMFRRVRLKIYKESQQDWIRNVTRNVRDLVRYEAEGFFPKRRVSCDTKYGYCIFTRVCDSDHPWQQQERLNNLFQIRENAWSAWR